MAGTQSITAPQGLMIVEVASSDPRDNGERITNPAVNEPSQQMTMRGRYSNHVGMANANRLCLTRGRRLQSYFRYGTHCVRDALLSEGALLGGESLAGVQTDALPVEHLVFHHGNS